MAATVGAVVSASRGARVTLGPCWWRAEQTQLHHGHTLRAGVSAAPGCVIGVVY
jgi:hypothetical protein